MTTLKQHVLSYQWQECFTASSSSINILLTTCPLPIKDHLNTIHAMVDSSGNLVEQYTYDAWGKLLSVKNGVGTSITKSAIGNRYLWQGREYSFSTGLYYFRARWYEPITGRWLSNDPIGISGGLNMYEFCGSNPVNMRDPSGLDFSTWIGGGEGYNNFNVAGGKVPDPSIVLTDIDELVKAISKKYIKSSDWLERGAVIYRYKDGETCPYKYSHTPVQVGSWFSVDVNYSMRNQIPANAELVGVWHSHSWLGRLNQPAFGIDDLSNFQNWDTFAMWLSNSTDGSIYKRTKVNGENQPLEKIK